MAINEQVKSEVVRIVKDYVAQLTDKSIVEQILKETGNSVSIGYVRKIRKELGIVKSAGRSVCRVVNGVDPVSKAEEVPF